MAMGPFPAQRTERTGFGVARSWDYQGVTVTVETMRRLVRDALLDEQKLPIRKLAEEIIAGIHGKDYLSEVAAIYYYALTNLRYTRDPVHVELVQGPGTTLRPGKADRAAGRRGGQEDCESIAIAIAALAMAIGNPCEYVTISTQPNAGFHHVFVVVTLPDGLRVVCDPVPGPDVQAMLDSTVSHQVWKIEPVRVPGRPGWGVAGFEGQPRHAGLGNVFDISQPQVGQGCPHLGGRFL